MKDFVKALFALGVVIGSIAAVLVLLRRCGCLSRTYLTIEED